MNRIVLLFLILPFQLFSQEPILKKGVFFKMDATAKYQYVGLLGQNIQPYMEASPEAMIKLGQYRNSQIVSIAGAGGVVIGVTSIIISIVASDQESCNNSSLCFFPNVDENKVWLFGFGSAALLSGFVVSPTAGIIARIKLKKAVDIHNSQLMGGIGLREYKEIPLKLHLNVQNGIGMGVRITF